MDLLLVGHIGSELLHDIDLKYELIILVNFNRGSGS